ncbi:MAG: hypothetical protein KBG20_14025 [Caldilineaceae bacterium]|nr:hypothetical protein [Caldilineaceae bacterium]MBP8106753.1 hypothetical protein [Caldilineaceae bacterium]MBP8123376.1 hypothetical protein [Caldilineaceae bacterium]MBP9073419.1 hypothetical protein [Caldilineaceae bacterium]
MDHSSTGPPKKRSRLRGCLIWLLILVVILAALAGVGYFAVQSGAVSLMQLEATMQGAGEISVVNASDAELTVRYIQLETENGDPTPQETNRLAPLDVGGLGGLLPGSYRIEFSSQGEGPPLATCTLRLGRGDQFTFVALTQGLVVTRKGTNAQDRADLLVESSSLCRP